MSRATDNALLPRAQAALAQAEACLNRLTVVIVALRGMVEEPERDLRVVAALVAAEYGEPPAAIRSHCRQMPLPEARMVALVLARESTAHGMQALARYFGHKSHTSVSWAQKTIGARASVEPRLAQVLARLRAKLRERLEAAA